jgi:hypothetical protein
MHQQWPNHTCKRSVWLCIEQTAHDLCLRWRNSGYFRHHNDVTVTARCKTKAIRAYTANDSLLMAKITFTLPQWVQVLQETMVRIPTFSNLWLSVYGDEMGWVCQVRDYVILIFTSCHCSPPNNVAIQRYYILRFEIGQVLSVTQLILILKRLQSGYVTDWPRLVLIESKHSYRTTYERQINMNQHVL